MLKPTVYLKRVHRVGRARVHHPTIRPSDHPTLTSGSDGRLRVEHRGHAVPVVVRRCFPWSEPARYISLRDEGNVEVALVEDPDELDRESRLALESALAAAGFVLEVTRVHSIEEEIEIRDWKVETRQGPRSFQTRLDDWPRVLPGGGVLIRDVAGDLYHVSPRERMDRRSRELLSAFVD